MSVDLLNKIDEQNKTHQQVVTQDSTNTTSDTSASVDDSKTSVSSGDSKSTTSDSSSSSVSNDSKPKAGATDRDKESLYDEIRELRAENKARRLQLEEEKTKVASTYEEKLKKFEEQMQTALSAKEELEALKAKEADKKRSIEERLAHREAMLAQIEAEKNALAEKLQADLQAREEELAELRTQQEAQKQVYEERINEELSKIPESRRKFAEMMIKGHGDPRDAWTALSEAKADGLFEDKVTQVVHTTPGADASRMTKERQEAIRHGERSGLSSTQRIKEGLKGINVKGQII